MSNPTPREQEMRERFLARPFEAEFLHGVPVKIPRQAKEKIADFWLAEIEQIRREERDKTIEEVIELAEFNQYVQGFELVTLLKQSPSLLNSSKDTK